MANLMYYSTKGLSRRMNTVLILSTFFTLFIFSYSWIDGRGSQMLQYPFSTTLNHTENSTRHGQYDIAAQSIVSILPPVEDPHMQQDSRLAVHSKSNGSIYTRTLVVARTSNENVDWISKELPELNTAIYVVNDPIATLHPPGNKGHEAMVFLTYIIDHYHHLPDVVICMHAHQKAYHNNALNGWDAVQMIRSLSSQRVLREGYMNLRCEWDPGCPDWIHPMDQNDNLKKIEQKIIGQVWNELFPDQAMTETLAQPCCAQFAVSRDQILSIPVERLVSYRDWLLRTPLIDHYSGRVLEYTWQFIFTGRGVLCPKMNVCYCDGYGFCFGGETQFEKWQQIYERMKKTQDQLTNWKKTKNELEKAQEQGDQELIATLEIPEAGRDTYLEEQIVALKKEMDLRRQAAEQRGKDPKNRAEEAGRPWSIGDGF